MKFKVGDKVKIKDNFKNIENFEGGYVKELEEFVGDICIISSIENNKAVKVKENAFTWDIRALEKVFTKSDLKDGDKCTLKDGRVVYYNKDDKYGPGYGFESLDENLRYDINDDVSVVKVERPTGYETVFERKEEILDEAEKRYLRNVIRPFKNDIKYIEKTSGCTKEYLRIVFKDDDKMNFKNFQRGTMYKSMEADKEYSLEELRIIGE